MKSKMIKLGPNSQRKRKIADFAAVPFTNPLLGKAMAEKTFEALGGKNVRVRKNKSWGRTRY